MRYEVNPKKPLLPKVISFDTEYTDLNIRKAEFLSASVGVSENLTYIFDKSGILQLNDLLQKAEIIFCWNMVVDWYIVRHRLNRPNGICVRKEKMIDGMLLEHLIDERLPHSLGEFAKREYNDDYKNTFWEKYNSYQEAPKDEAYEYEMRDGCFTYRAGVKFLELLRGKMELVKHVHRLQWALFDTEVKGLKVNKNLMIKTKEEMSAKINMYLPKLREEFNDYCTLWELDRWRSEIQKRSSPKGKSGVPRPEFSFTSDPQIRWLLYDALELPILEKTKKGAPKTDTETLKTLSLSYPEITTLLEYKETKSLYSTFVEGMLERVEDGSIYPHFNVNGTPTGRLASSNPNLQNIPQEGVIRNFLLPDDGCQIIGADYESLEVGVEANLTEDPALLSIMMEGASKHDITAAAVGLPRKDAKTLNFLCQYGGGEWKIQKTFGVSAEDAKEILEKYWQAYSGVKKYKEKVFRELELTNQVTNCFGRTRHFSKPRNEFEKGKFERQAYSHMIQGPGAEMTNIATYRLREEFNNQNIGRFLFPVHDECVLSAKTHEVERAKNLVVKTMEDSNEVLGFKYRIKAKAYGGFEFWQKA